MSSDQSTGDDMRGRLGDPEGVDDRLVDLLAWVLDTETRARIYIYLRMNAPSTGEEIAAGTGLYPSTVREALAALAEDGVVVREKRAADGAGNNPYEYEAVPPADLVRDIVDEVQAELNTIFNLDEVLDAGKHRPSGWRTARPTESGPVSVSVRDAQEIGG